MKLYAARTFLVAVVFALVLGGSPARAQLVEPEKPKVKEPAQRRGGMQRIGRPNAPARNPDNKAAQGDGTETPASDSDTTGEMISLAAFSEPVELTALIEFVQVALDINIATEGEPSGTVVFNAPIEIPRDKLLRLLDAMLERHGFTVSFDTDTGFYVVHPSDQVRSSFEGELATTRIIHTPNIKPSLLQDAVASALGFSSGAGGGGATTGPVRAIDELGVLLITAPPRTIRAAETLINELMSASGQITLHRIELNHLAAPVARERAIGLVGGASAQPTQLNARQRQQITRNQPQGATGLGGSTLSNLADRLAVDPQGNALLFRGTPDEVASVRELIGVIDVPSDLMPRNYFAGSAAQQIADIASQRGLGEVVTLNQTQQANINRFINTQNQGAGQSQTTVGGPVMVVDLKTGRIVYYGTESQHARLAELMEELKTEDDRIVIKAYKLRHTSAEDIADTLDAIITGQQRTGDSPLLPNSQGGGQGGGQAQVRRDLTAVVTPDGDITFTNASGDEVSGAFDPDQVIVVPDLLNNQVIVRAPVRQQGELKKLIDRLDLRRDQVFIEALVVLVSDTSDFRLAIETQILNGQYGIQTNFGLSSTPTGGTFQDQRLVATGLAGLTSAVIQSGSIPVILNALQTDTDARILSAPSLLVNDNEEASIVSLDEQATTSSSQGTNSTITSFAGYETAGTNLTVTPSISDGGYLRLIYEVELSSFTSDGADGIPGDRSTNTVASSVTLPSDATIVVGGIKVRNTRDTVVKVPLLGDIPLLGQAFRDTRKNNTDSVLYVFITPRIMTDPNFYDLKLYSRGPQAEVEVDAEVPELEPALIRPARLLDAPAPLPLPPAGAAPGTAHALPPVEQLKPAEHTPEPAPPIEPPAFTDAGSGSAGTVIEDLEPLTP